MITNKPRKVKKNHQGSSFVSPAYGWCGARATKNTIARPSKKNWAKPKQAGKKEGGLGEGIFARPPRRLGWESVSAIPASAGRQNRKIFVSLIEKNFGGAPLKNVKKIFLFCSPSGGRKRWAGFLPVRAEIVARKRFELRPAIATNQKPRLTRFLCGSPLYQYIIIGVRIYCVLIFPTNISSKFFTSL